MPFNLPRITKALLIANIVGFALQWMLGERAYVFELWPLADSAYNPSAEAPSFMPWQVLTFGFMHESFGHLFFNMLALAMFGAPLEYTWGERRFAAFYFVCLMGAALFHLMYASWVVFAQSAAISAIGASGAIYGLVLAYGMSFPHQRVSIFPIPMLLNARTVAAIYIGFAVLYGVFGSRGGISHFAHLSGMLFGWLLIRYWRGQPPFGGSKPSKPSKSSRPPLRIVK